MLIADKMQKVRIYVHQQYLDQTLFNLAKAEIIHQIDIKSEKEIKDKLQLIEPSEHQFRIASTLSKIQTLLPSRILSKTFDKSHMNLPTEEELNNAEHSIEQIETKASDLRNQIADISKKEEKTEKEIEKIKALENQIKNLLDEHGDKLQSFYQLFKSSKIIEDTKTKIGKTKKTFIFEGWTPERRLTELKSIVENSSQGYAITAPIEADIEKNPPPTRLSNPSIAYVYQQITSAFGLPNYREIDPSLIMLFSFPIIFGLMFGDIGHGAILLGFSIMLYMLKRRHLDAGELFNYLIGGSPMLIMCSILSIVFGFVYGEVFGAESYYKIIENFIYSFSGVKIQEAITEGALALERTLSSAAGFRIRIPFPLNPFTEPNKMFLISIYVAVIQISLGLILGIINRLRIGEVKEALLDQGLWLWFYWSFAYLIIRYRSKLLSVLFSDVKIIGFFIVLPAIVLFMLRIGFFKADGFSSALESLISSISNTISYARILALALAHTSFSKILMMFLAYQGLTMKIAGIFMWSIFTFLLILCFECLLSFIHTLRLHWVEWFLKFYSGNGIQYKPITLRD